MRRTHHKESGFSLAALIMFVTVLSILAAAAAPVMVTEARREVEEELVFRGEEYVRAIQKYQRQFGVYPPDIDSLLESNEMHFLRREYVDPITGEPFRLIKANPDGTLEGSRVYTYEDLPLFAGPLGAGAVGGDPAALGLVPQAVQAGGRGGPGNGGGARGGGGGARGGAGGFGGGGGRGGDFGGFGDSPFGNAGTRGGVTQGGFGQFGNGGSIATVGAAPPPVAGLSGFGAPGAAAAPQATGGGGFPQAAGQVGGLVGGQVGGFGNFGQQPAGTFGNAGGQTADVDFSAFQVFSTQAGVQAGGRGGGGGRGGNGGGGRGGRTDGGGRGGRDGGGRGGRGGGGGATLAGNLIAGGGGGAGGAGGGIFTLGAGVAGGVTGGTAISGIVGVGANSEATSLRVYNDRDIYAEWEFIALPTSVAGQEAQGLMPGDENNSGQPNAFGNDGASPFNSAPNPFQ